MSEEKPDEVEPVEEERAGSKEVLGEGWTLQGKCEGDAEKGSKKCRDNLL